MARGAAAVLAAAVLLVVAFRWINPPTTLLMLQQGYRLGGVNLDWVGLEAMASYLPLSAAAAEDADFCSHWGFDIEGIRAAIFDQTRLRGGSTISQQVAKNVFLWPTRSWLRKGLEAGFTVLIEAFWPKHRIIEVYLNVAEFGEGTFGVEAAARRYWSTSAAKLGPQRASRLMAVLPDPRNRSPVSGTRYIIERGRSIERGAATLRDEGRAACFLD